MTSDQRDDLDYRTYIEELFHNQGTQGYELEFIEGAEEVVGVSREELLDAELVYEHAFMGMTRVVKSQRDDLVLYSFGEDDPWFRSEKFPHNFADYPGLRKIRIGDYNDGSVDESRHIFKQLPNDIDKLYDLEELTVMNSFLDSVPEAVFNLNKLEILNLSNNKLTEIPTEIGNLENLKELRLSRNSITELPEEIDNLQNLKLLSVSNNKLTEIPAEIGNLQKLERLILSNNPISSIPESLANLSKHRDLTQFSVNSLNLSDLPPAIWRILDREHLSLIGNQFSSLPDIILESQTIEFLSLANNNFTHIPPINRMKCLNKLDIRDNPIDLEDERNKVVLDCPNLEYIRVGREVSLPDWLQESGIFIDKT